MEPIAAIISYCSNDFRFLGKCIQEAKEFAQRILVVVCDHFFNGQGENRARLEETYTLYPEIDFIEFAYDPEKIYSPYHRIGPADPDWPIYWAATARYIGYYFTQEPWLFFLDSDEIAEGERLNKWLQKGEHFDFVALRFACYQYGLTARERAKEVMGAALLVQRKALAPLLLLNDLERLGTYRSMIGEKKDFVLVQRPFFHHYSWVRTKEECLMKAESWGHSKEKNWAEAVDRAFGGDLSGLFFQPYQFESIDSPFFDPLQVKRLNGVGAGANVQRINVRAVRKKEMEMLL